MDSGEIDRMRAPLVDVLTLLAYAYSCIGIASHPIPASSVFVGFRKTGVNCFAKEEKVAQSLNNARTIPRFFVRDVTFIHIQTRPGTLS